MRQCGLLPNACRLLDQAAELEQQFLGNAVGGVIDIGASFTIANHVIVDAMVDFQKQHPNIEIRITSDNSPGITERLASGDLDFGLIESPVTDPAILCAPWLEDELVIFSSPDHPLGKKDQVLMSDLVTTPCVLRERGSGARNMFNETFAAHVNTIDIAMEFRHNEPIKRAVARNVGIGCLSKKPFLALGMSFFPALLAAPPTRMALLKTAKKYSLEWLKCIVVPVEATIG